MELTQIQQLWNFFILSESSSYEKSTWCDIFLCQFIVSLNGSNPEEILTFCNCNGVGTLIGCELLSDIDQICSEPGDGEDLRPLRQYLLTKAWKALVVLIKLSPQNFSCSNELANLLVSLFPVCFEAEDIWTKAALAKVNKYVPKNKDYELDSFFAVSSIASKTYGLNGQGLSKIDYFRCVPALINVRNKRLVQGITCPGWSNDVNSSESENVSDVINIINNSCGRKVKLDAINFDHFTEALQSKSDDLNRVLYRPRRRSKHSLKISPYDFIDEKIKDVMFSQVSSYEFCMLIIQLLTSLCTSEQFFVVSTETSYSVSLKSIKFALENLCSLQFDIILSQTRDAINLKYALTQLLVICMEKLLGCPDVVTNAVFTGILPMTLKILDDVVCKLSDISEAKDNENLSYEMEKQHQIIFGLMCGVISFLYNLLTKNPCVKEFQSFSELFKTFIESNNGKLIEKAVTALIKFGQTIRANKVIELLGQLIIILKKVRTDLINPRLNPKRFRFRKSKNKTDLGQYQINYHHYHVFENISGTSNPSSYQNCCVSSLFLMLYKLLDNHHNMPIDIINQTLKIMNFCGTCCCFPKENLLEPFIEIIRLPSQKTRHLVFQLLENTLYSELGCYNIPEDEEISCSICLKNSFENVERKYQMNDITCRRGNISKANSELGSNFETFYVQNSSLKLDLFKDLLSSDDFKMVQGVTAHLLKCAPKMTDNGKRTIVFNIFIPIFLASKEKFIAEKDEISAFKILSCLSIFYSLLHNLAFAKLFIVQKVIDHIVDLLSITTFTGSCCLILEKTIALTTISGECDVTHIPILTTLRKVVNEMNASFLKSFGKTERNNCLHILDSPRMQKNFSSFKKEEKEEINQQKMIDILENVCTLWRTYANLALRSPYLKEYFSQMNFLGDCNKLLKVALYSLASEEVSGKNMRFDNKNFHEATWLTKLIESLLMFILAISGKGENESKEEEKSNVITIQFSQNLMIDNLRSVDILKLAEILLKCSLMQSTLFEKVPIASMPKFRFFPLKDPCEKITNADELEKRIFSESESEDNYVTADEGYDADIELRDTMTSPGEPVNDNFKDDITESIVFLSRSENTCENHEQKRNNPTIVYPSLCMFALDLLIRLYQENSMEKYETQNGGNNSVFLKGNTNEKANHRPKILTSEIVVDTTFENENKYGEKPFNLSEINGRETNDGYGVEEKDLGKHCLDNKDKLMAGLIFIFQRLAFLCRDKPENTKILCKNRVILKLLCGFHSCFIDAKRSLADLQKVILELITILAKHCITPEELSIYLGFFKYNNPPLDHLLVPLLNLVASHNPQPNRSLQFPISALDINGDCTSANFELTEEKVIQCLQKTKGIESSWNSAAVLLPIDLKWNWAVWAQGFSLSLWLKIGKMQLSDVKPNCQKRIHKTSKTDNDVPSYGTIRPEFTKVRSNENLRFMPSKKRCMHVFSFGNHSMTLECWHASDSESFVWKLSKIDNERGYEIISEKTVKHGLSTLSWSHLAVNVKTVSSEKKTLLEIGLFCDGKKENVIHLPVTDALSRKHRSSFLLLGAKEDDHSKEPFSFGSLKLFASPIFTRERAVYLLGLGPNCINLTDCQIDHRKPNFTTIFPIKTLTSYINWEAVLNTNSECVQCLQNHLFLTYSAENPFFFNIYPANFLASSRHLFPSFRQPNPEPKATQREPVSVKCLVLGSLNQFQYQSLVSSAYVLGGSSTFMFLFARVIEISSDPEVQRKFLFLFLKFVQSDNDLFAQFIKNDHHNMLHKIFSVSKCCSGPHVLKAIMDASCDKPIIKTHETQFKIVHQCNAIIVNSFLIPTILKFWKYWSPAMQTNEALELLFSSLLTLVRDENPYREFNVYQLNRMKILNSLFSFSKERLLYDDVKTISQNVSFSIVELIKALMNAPPEFKQISDLMDFLILLHPASGTFVTHTKGNFYPLLETHTHRIIQGEPKAECLKNTTLKSRSYRFLENWMRSLNVNSQFKKITSHKFVVENNLSNTTESFTNLQLQSDGIESENFEILKQKIYNDESDKKDFGEFSIFDFDVEDNDKFQFENFKENEFPMKPAGKRQQNLMSSFLLNFTEEPQNNANCYTNAYSEEKSVKLEMFKNREPQSIIAEGLLLLLRDILSMLPDSMAQRVLNRVIKPEILLVLANEKDHQVRSAVVKVFSSYFQRCSEEDKNKFIKSKGFYHLANQLSLFPASRELLEDCLHLMMRTSISLENHDFLANQKISHFGANCFSVLLALMPRCIHDLSLAHNLINMTRRIYSKDENLSRILLEIGLLESLMKTLIGLIHFDVFAIDNSYQRILLPDLYSFFIAILNRVINTPGNSNTQVLTDVFLELNYLLELEKNNCGFQSKCLNLIRNMFCKILKGALDIIQKKITSVRNGQKNLIRDSGLNGNYRTNFKVEKNYTNGFATKSIASSPASPRDFSKSEFCERIKFLITSAIDFLVFSGNLSNGNLILSPTETGFIHHIFPLLLQIISANIENSNFDEEVYWAIKDSLKTKVFELFAWMISPRQALKIRIFALNVLVSRTNHKSLLLTLLQTSNEAEHKFSVYLSDLTCNNQLSKADLKNCMVLAKTFKKEKLLLPNAVGNNVDLKCLKMSCDSFLADADRLSESWRKGIMMAAVSCSHKYDVLLKGMSESAVLMTFLVVNAQNSERKSFIETMKLHDCENFHLLAKWRILINRLTHEKAVWYFEKSYPMFWELDPTEGPSRVRKRLSRCHLNVGERYFLQSERQKLNKGKIAQPLAYLFEEATNGHSTAIIEKHHCNEKIRSMFSASIVTPAAEISGELLLGETSIYFVADDSQIYQSVNNPSMDVLNMAWLFCDVKEIHTRRFELQERAVELFLMNGKTYFIAFETSDNRNAFLTELDECDLPNRVPSDNLIDIMLLWREGHITNWEYLTHLNKLAGRSYNDLMQYPVYPFVLSDYCSAKLDLNNQEIFRDFKKPMAVQDKKNEQHYINNYNELLGGLKQVSVNKEPYHYGSHYSNSGTVLHFLVRLPPFTKLLLQYQDKNFDLPDRTFHSLHTTWRLASSESTTDVKEMIPEFFFLPEFLMNFQGFDFGIRQNGERVSNVLLPPWCKGDSRKFILIHRQALESDYVTKNIPHWIDLVFGFKQTGKAAVEAINVFHPATYSGFKVETIIDPVEKVAWETMVKTYGQTPKQLLSNPHPLITRSIACGPVLSKDSQEDVKGLKWGCYVGSPTEPDPLVVFKQLFKGKEMITDLVPLATNDVLGLPPSSASLILYRRGKCPSMVNANGIQVALVSWEFTDGVIRVKVKKEMPAVPLLSTSVIDPVTTCSTAPGCNYLWMGHTSGNLTVFKFDFSADQDCIESLQSPIALQGHKNAVTGIRISPAYSIVVSSSLDGEIIVWDLNNVSYVRSLDLNLGPVNALAVSETLGDIASVTLSANSVIATNILRLHTINATFVDSITIEETVTSMCFSTAPEGVSINVIACGLSNGSIKLFSTWDLSHLRDITHPSFKYSIISLTYSHDSSQLYASYSDGIVAVWENPGRKSKTKPSKLLNIRM